MQTASLNDALSYKLDVYDAAEKYQEAGYPLLVLAGKEYGSGSSRDWAAKGPFLLVSIMYTFYLMIMTVRSYLCFLLAVY